MSDVAGHQAVFIGRGHVMKGVKKCAVCGGRIKNVGVNGAPRYEHDKGNRMPRKR